MTPNLVYVITIGALFAAGVTLMLERSLTRVLMGAILLSNGVNLLILAGGQFGDPPIVGVSEPERMSDPLPQAMILTAIVITLGMSAFLLAMAYRSWQLVGHDEVRDDVEDRRIVRLAERDQALDSGNGGTDAGGDDGPDEPYGPDEPSRDGGDDHTDELDESGESHGHDEDDDDHDDHDDYGDHNDHGDGGDVDQVGGGAPDATDATDVTDRGGGRGPDRGGEAPEAG